MILALIDTWIGWIVFIVFFPLGWYAHAVLPSWWNERRASKYRCAVLNAYWSHEITAQEAAKQLNSPKARR